TNAGPAPPADKQPARPAENADQQPDQRAARRTHEPDVVGAVRDLQLTLRRTLHDSRRLELDVTAGVGLLQLAQRLVGLTRLREPNDNHVFLSHYHSFQSNIPDKQRAPAARNRPASTARSSGKRRAPSPLNAVTGTPLGSPR